MPRLKPRDLRPVVTYDRDAILDLGHVAVALGVSEETAAALDLPCMYVGTRGKYLWGQVLDEIAARSHVDAQPKPRRVS
jgi:hypothetical protein